MKLEELNEAVSCSYCTNPATIEAVWNEGRATVPVCNDHVAKAKQDVKARGGEVVQTRALL